MGFTLVLGITVIFSALLGSCCVLPGVIFSFKYHDRVRLTVAIFALAICWIPLFAGPKAFQYLVNLKGLVLAD